MKNKLTVRQHMIRAALPLLLATGLAPSMASATQIELTGVVTKSLHFGSSPFAVGDPVSGLFNVDTSRGGNFYLSGLEGNFYLKVGTAVFDLTPEQLQGLGGSVTSDGMLEHLSLISDSRLVVPGLSGTFALAFNGVNQPFSLLGSLGTSTDGDFSGQVVTAVNDVPEPSSFTLLAMALGALGFAAGKRKRAGQLDTAV